MLIVVLSLPSATDEAWRLLASYLEKHPTQNAQHHRCVINKLLSHGVPLPDWMVNTYKVRERSICANIALNATLCRLRCKTHFPKRIRARKYIFYLHLLPCIVT